MYQLHSIITLPFARKLLGNSTFHNNGCNSGGASDWYKNFTSPTWPRRAGHQVVLEVPAAINAFSPRVYVIGGHNEGGILGDTW